jgi:hypothetical protein
MDSPECGIAWKTCTRVRWARLDSLVVVMNCCHSWVFMTHMCHVVRWLPCKVSIDLSLHDTLGYE